MRRESSRGCFAGEVTSLADVMVLIRIAVASKCLDLVMLDSLLINPPFCFRFLSTPSGSSVDILAGSIYAGICPLYPRSGVCDCKDHCVPFQVLTRTLILIRGHPRPYCYFPIPTLDIFPEAPSTPSRVVSVGFHANGLSNRPSILTCPSHILLSP